MREIKFRVWCKDLEEIIEVNKMGFENNELWYIECIDHDKELVYFPEKNDHVLMQYTGLKDKNGKEIYFDSDFVNLKVWTGYEPPYVCSVTHDVIDERKADESIYRGIITKDEFSNPMIGDFYFANLPFADKYEFEVIGNIYDNPSLLEESK